MSEARGKSLAQNIIVRSYHPGDEAKIVEFLDKCYGEWKTRQEWQLLYADYPTFSRDDVVIFEVGDEIIGHGGTHLRNLVFQKWKLLTATLSDAAINPSYRGRGLYTQLVDTRLKRAKSKGACLGFAWHLKGSNAFKHNKRAGFIEVKQSAAYMKIMNPEKVLKTGLYDVLHKNQSLRWALQGLEDNLCFRVGEATFSVAELLGRTGNSLKEDRRKIQIVLDDKSLLTMINFRNMDRLEKIAKLLSLILRRRIKIKVNSLKVLLDLARNGVAVVGSF